MFLVHESAKMLRPPHETAPFPSRQLKRSRRVGLHLILHCFGALCFMVSFLKDQSDDELGSFGAKACTRHACNPLTFAWPTKPMKLRRGATKRSKQQLISVLRDYTTHPGKTQWAIKLMRKFKFFTSSWEYVLGIKKLTQVGLTREALSLWSEMNAKGIDPTPATYTAAIVALQSSGQWRKAVELVDDMEVRNMCPLRIGCEHALMAYERGAMWQQALHLMDRMWDYGIGPDENTFMPVIRACENGGQMELGDKLFWQMRERTKLLKIEEDVPKNPLDKYAPKAEPAPWRLPGAVAPDAYDPPRLAKERMKREAEEAEARQLTS